MTIRTTATVGDATVSVTYDDINHEGRRCYSYTITTPQWEFVGNDLCSGVGAAVDVTDMLRALAGFLGACAEARDYRDRNEHASENTDLFPEHVGQWAQANSDELSLLDCDVW